MRTISVVLIFLISSLGFTQDLRPNIIIILADDQGYGDLSSYGSPTISTPNIDRLATEGIKSTSFYSAGPVCAPSRRGLLTGRYAARIDADGNERSGNMLAAEITLAELFKENGYYTAAIGKWHLGMKEGSNPNDQGFDYFFGTPSSNDHFPKPGYRYSYKNFKNANYEDFNVPLIEQSKEIERPAIQGTLTQRYTKKVLDIITNRSDAPFFIYLAYNMPHVPVFPSKDFDGISYGGRYADVNEEIDWSVGEIVKTLEKQNLAQNTLIVYTSDNGAWKIYRELGGSQGPFRNGKGTAWEGGHRVPGIFWWPGKIQPRIVQEPISSLDFFHTFSSLLGKALPKDRVYDSEDLLPMLIENAKSPRKSFFYFSENKNKLWAVRDNKFKIHMTSVEFHRAEPENHDPPLLFNLKNDPSESYNINSQLNEDKIKKLLDLAENMKKQLKEND